MSSSSKSKSKDKKIAKETPKASSKSSNHANTGGGISTSGYNPLSRTFHKVDLAAVSSGAPLHASAHFRNIDETDDGSGYSFGTVSEHDSVSNNGSWSGEHETTSLLPPRQGTIPSADNDKQEKIRQKNEKKHQRQKERRAQELHEKCSSYLMSRKLEGLAQQLVAMGFPLDRATMALILNEGRVEESVTWLFTEGEVAYKYKEHNLGSGGNLKIDISDELAHIVDLEIRYQCSNQEVERVLVACEGDFVKTEETLRSRKQKPLMPPTQEETGNPPTVGSSKLPLAAIQNFIVAPKKVTSSTNPTQKRDEKASNYSKVTTVASSSIDPGNKIAQSLKRAQPKKDLTKPPVVVVPADKRLPGAESNPPASYSLTSPQPVKVEAQYEAVGDALKNLQLGSLREHVVPMQLPQPISAKQIPTPSVSSSSSCPPGTSAGWFPNTVAPLDPSGLTPHVLGPRNLNPNSVSKSELYSQLHYQQQQPQQCVSNTAFLEPLGTSWGNNLWNITTPQSHSLAAAPPSGLYSAFSANAQSSSSPSVGWKPYYSVPQINYNKIDWRLDLPTPSDGIWSTMNFLMQSNNPRTYDPFTSALGGRAAAVGPVVSNRNGVSMLRSHDRGAGTHTPAIVLHEWASPFEERDLFGLQLLRQFVSSPSL
nr:uncharacterized protein LOC109152383 [Ipomoea batatas]